MAKKRTTSQKVQRRIQDICYNGYARKPFGLWRNYAEIFSASHSKELFFSETMGTNIYRRRSSRAHGRTARKEKYRQTEEEVIG